MRFTRRLRLSSPEVTNEVRCQGCVLPKEEARREKPMAVSGSRDGHDDCAVDGD